jgi:hypothetical protein
VTDKLVRLSGLTTWGIRVLVVRVKTIKPRLAAYRQKVIDAEYVVEERVQNYEPEPQSQPGPQLFQAGVPGSVAVDGPNEAAPFEDEDLEAMGLGDYEMMEDASDGEIVVGGGYNGVYTPPLRRELIYEDEENDVEKFPGEGSTLGGKQLTGEEKETIIGATAVLGQTEDRDKVNDDADTIDA